MRCASPVIAERGLALALFVLVAGCGELWPLAGQPKCEDFDTTIKPVLTASCVECHGEAKAEAGYRVDTRDFAVARLADGTTVVQGEEPLFLEAANGHLPGHTPVSEDDLKTLTKWVTVCRAGPGPIRWHPRGWVTPGDEHSHAKELRETGYQLTECKKCHGDDLKGGLAKVACTTCHEKGPFDDCSTCHGNAANPAPPRDLSGASLTSKPGVGAHQTHVTDGPLHLAFGCEKCHAKVTEAFQEGHFQVDGGPEDGFAEVVLEGRDGGAPVWDRTATTCASTSCHAPLADTAATNQTPNWTVVDGGQAVCGSCHGLPPSTHGPETDCGLCHVTARPDGGVVAALHLDGVVQVGRLPDGTAPATVTCGSCHWDGAGPARDTRGNTDTSLTTVGLHAAHVQGKLKLSAPIGCNECHLVPTTIRDVGHIDTAAPAEVFPSGFSPPRANKDDATPAWDRQTATCSNVYCHGSGTVMSADTSPSKVTTMQWTAPFALTCATCHGLPPNTPVHDDGGTPLTLQDCASCHPTTMAPAGNLILTTGADGGVVTTHLNGTIDVGP